MSDEQDFKCLANTCCCVVHSDALYRRIGESLRSSLKQAQDALAEAKGQIIPEGHGVVILDTYREQRNLKIKAESELSDFKKICQAAVSLKREIESERDQLAAAVEKMREALDEIQDQYINVVKMLDDKGVTVVSSDKFIQSADRAIAIPTNYKSILEARDKRVRAKSYRFGIEYVIQELQESASIEGGAEDDPKLNALADFSVRLIEYLRELAEKGENG